MNRRIGIDVCIVIAMVCFILGALICCVLFMEWLYKEDPRDEKALKGYNKHYNKAHPVFSAFPFILIERVLLVDAIWLHFGWMSFSRRVLLYRKHKK